MLALLLLSTVCAAGEAVTPDPAAQLSIGRHLAVLVEDGAPLSPEEIDAQPCFQPSTRDEPGWGFARRTLWVRFHTTPVDDPSGWLLHAGFPRPHHIELFQKDAAGRWTKRAEGGLLSPPGRGLVAHDVSLPIELTAGEHLLRVDAQPARLNLALVTRAQRAVEEGRELLGSGVYFGIFLGLFLYNLFLGLSLRDRAHLYYCFFLVCIATHVAAREGLVHADAPTPLFENGGGMAVTSLVVLLFARHFLRLPERGKRHRRFLVVDRLGVGLTWLSGALVLATFAGLQLAAVTAMVSVATIALVVTAATLAVREGDRPAGWFLLAWSVLIASCLALVLHAFGVIDGGRLASRALMFGSATEMVLLSLALASRVRLLRSEKELAEKSLVEARGQAQSELAGRVMQAQEEERTRFAHELHDGIGHALLLLKQQLLNAARGGEAIAPNEATRLGAQAQQCIDDARAMARNLVPASIAQLGLLDVIRQTCRGAASASGIDVRLDDEGTQALEMALFEDRAIHVLRVVQEAMANAVRHGEAGEVRVVVRVASQRLIVSVEDDGAGFDPSSVPAGRLGLVAMEQRARLLEGHLSVTSQAGQGTRVELSVPLASVLAGET